MRLGNSELRLVSDGVIRMDGGNLFGITPKAIWSRQRHADRKNRLEVALNCILIQHGGKNVLVDTGVGTKHDARTRAIFAMRGGKLISSLAAVGISPNDIDLVVLTHLHFDHAGGCTRFEPGRRPVPVFPRAAYIVQRADWQEATVTNERTRHAYWPQDFLPLEESKQLELVDGDVELLSGLWARRTGGHTGGHQMACIESAGERAACLGDILPTPQHLPVHYLTAFDLYPLETLEAKRRWLKQAEQERWLLLFGHAMTDKAGYLTTQEGRPRLIPYDIEADEFSG